ncbi:hypothetical protein HDU97_003193 [Phlyctochytrium planicorne]|nr:hypothetical protein HDU97_003193 [Phlyctochytrium planicorne]
MDEGRTDGFEETPLWQKIVGVSLAVSSGFLIGSSVVFTKKGLIQSRSREVGREHAYLKNFLWWIGMILMGLGEVANFGAYAFTAAILVTPLGALSVVISAILSSIFLKERLNFAGKVGCFSCVIGSIIIVINAPASSTTQTVEEFFQHVLAPAYLEKRYAHKTPMIYILIASLIGPYLALSTQGFGTSMIYALRHWSDPQRNQFLKWPMYPLFLFMVVAIITQIHYLNRAYSLYNTAVVTPIFYVTFTTATLVASAVLYRGFPVGSLVAGLSIVMGFLVIVGGVALLFQYSMELLAAEAVNVVNVAASISRAPSIRSVSRSSNDEPAQMTQRPHTPFRSASMPVGSGKSIAFQPPQMPPGGGIDEEAGVSVVVETECAACGRSFGLKHSPVMLSSASPPLLLPPSPLSGTSLRVPTPLPATGSPSLQPLDDPAVLQAMRLYAVEGAQAGKSIFFLEEDEKGFRPPFGGPLVEDPHHHHHHHQHHNHVLVKFEQDPLSVPRPGAFLTMVSKALGKDSGASNGAGLPTIMTTPPNTTIPIASTTGPVGTESGAGHLTSASSTLSPPSPSPTSLQPPQESTAESIPSPPHNQEQRLPSSPSIILQSQDPPISLLRNETEQTPSQPSSTHQEQQEQQ